MLTMQRFILMLRKKNLRGLFICIGHISVPQLASPIIPKTGRRSLENWRTSHLTFHAIKFENKTKHYSLKLQSRWNNTSLIQSHWKMKSRAFMKVAFILLDCMKLSGVSITSSMPYTYGYEGQWVFHKLSSQLNAVCVFNLSITGQLIDKVKYASNPCNDR